MTSIQWYTLSPRTLEKTSLIIQCILKDPFLNQTQISRLVRIPRPTVCRIINKLAEVGAIRKIVLNVAGNRAYKYEVNPKFLDFLSKNLSTNVECSIPKGRGFSPTGAGVENDTAQINESSSTNSSKKDSKKKNGKNSKTSNLFTKPIITRPDDPEELEKWCRNGFFRIHGFQRKFVLRNYRLVKNDEKWETLTLLLDGDLIKLRIGRNGSGLCYIINVWSDTFKVHFSLQFRSNTLIVTLPKKESIYVPWDIFSKDIEEKILEEIKVIAERAIKVYSEVFNQQVLMKDAGWVGKRKKLRPEVAYVDPDGIIRKVYEVEGATYIEGLGYWVDGSLKSSPEVEFDSVETASNFKKAVDILASGELDREINEVKEKMESLSKKVLELDESIQTLIAKGVEVGVREATQQLVSTMLGGVRPVQDQLNEMWKRISDMQETLNLMLMYQIAKENGDKDLAEAIKVKLMKRAGLV